MILPVNLRHLERGALELRGELAPSEVDWGPLDELLRVVSPLAYRLQVTRQPEAILIEGRLECVLQCECARCLKPFPHRLALDPWVRLLALTGDDAVAVENDCVDLTLVLREDMLLEFPQRPLCEPECRGLPRPPAGHDPDHGPAGPTAAVPSAWAVLDRLKLKD